MQNFERITFAGFSLPRTTNGPTIYNPTTTPLLARLKVWKANGKTRGCIGPVTYPDRIRTAETAREFNGWGCYISGAHRLDDRTFDLRWQYADEVDSDWYADDDAPYRVGHSGWYQNAFFEGDCIRGIVAKLPRGRGFLAGWTMGPGMITELDCHAYGYCSDAIAAADSMAESTAEREREYQANVCPECGEHADDCECEGDLS